MQNAVEKSVSSAASGGNLPLKKYDLNVKAIQDLLKKNGVKMSAIEIRELMRNKVLSPDESTIKNYLRHLRQGF